MKEQLQSLLELLNQGLVQRQAVIRPVLLAALAGENPVLVGPPGTGKSLIARRIAQCFPNEDAEQGSYFEYLLTKFSTPEEIFGPLSISELKQDRFKRNTAGYLPSVRVAFLDEIFKASSSILNALLTILNERVYHNGAQVQRVPLQALIAASNELPTDHEELSALYDRFLLRVFVDYVGAEHLPALFATTTEPDIPAQLRLTQKQLTALRSTADAVRIPDDMVQAVQQIWAEHQTAFKEDARERLSDRRLKKLIHLMRVSAATNGRDTVDLSDVLLLKDSLWNHPDNREKVMELLTKVLGRFNQVIPLPAGEAAAPVPLRKKDTGQMNVIVKGYKGRGTEDDPLLIESVANLIDLRRPEVGQKGYYFQQTQDIDLSTIDEDDWPFIRLKINYNGNGFKISKFNSVNDSSHPGLLWVAMDSSFENIFLEESSIAIFGGDLTKSLIGNLYCNGNVQMNCCEIDFVSLGSDIDKYFDVKSAALGCLGIDNSIVHQLEDFEKISAERSMFFISPMLFAFKDCSLTDVVLVSDDKSANFLSCLNMGSKYSATSRVIHFYNRNNLQQSLSKLQIIARSDPSGKFSTFDILNSQRTQYYFEHTLGFDFENVWRWDKASKIPALRYVGVGASAEHKSQSMLGFDAGSVDLLSMQIQANIWL